MKRLVFPFILILISTMPLTAESITVLSEERETELDLNYTHVMKVRAAENAGLWRFDVTLRHGDEGWDHYANLWVVVDVETGEEYGRRVLAHPHVNEQPFTRSQSGIRIPEGVTAVTVKAACNVHGFGGTELAVQIK
ncbi:MAG: hypothetical protein JEZ04_07925 [Spirochaetales bacterium]|nr:hypothetical protein [Spirochaetales bacterium]